MRSPRLRFAALFFALVIALPAARAFAYEDSVTFGLGAGYAYAASSRLPDHGVQLAVSSSFEMDGPWALRPRFTASHHPDGLELIGAAAELVYLVDIVELVPYFGTGVGVLGAHHDDELGLEPTMQNVIGVDYLLSFDWALELDAAVTMRLLHLEHDPVVLSATVSLIWLLPTW